MIELNDNKKKCVCLMCPCHCCASSSCFAQRDISDTFLMLTDSNSHKKEIQSHIEIVKNDIQRNFNIITICPNTMYLPIPAIAMYGQNWCTWDNHQPRHIYIDSSVTDSTWCTYNNHLFLYLNTDSIASKTSCTYHVKLLATTLLIPSFFT